MRRRRPLPPPPPRVTEGPTQNAKGFIQVTGLVTEALPSATFRVQLDTGHTLLGHLAGRMRMHRIRLLPGDKVLIEMTPYDLTKGRIVYRLT